MILISRKVDYAILILHSLMRSPAGVSARGLAEAYALSKPFTANILKVLCQEGLVDSKRGAAGGYRLARPASEISLANVVNALYGPFQLMSCANSNEDVACKIGDVCPVRSPLRVVHHRLLGVLNEVTLADLGVEDDLQLVSLNVEMPADGCAANLPGS